MIITSGVKFTPGLTLSTNVPPLVTTGLTMQLDPNNAASYPGSGSTWYDISGNSANISLTGSPTYLAGPPALLSFNGSTQYGTGSTSQVLYSTSYTKTVWFNLNAYTDNNLISSSAGGHFMFFGASTNRIQSGHGDWPDYAAYKSTATFSLNVWYYVALTFDTTNGMTLYVNGYQDSTYTANKNPFIGDGSVNIAQFGGGGNLLNGRIGHVFCYNTALTAAEVLQNFNSVRALYNL